MFTEEEGRSNGTREDVQRVQDLGVRNQWQPHEVFNLPTAEQRPDPCVLAHRIVAGRMSRPVGTVAAEPLQEHVESAVALVPIGVQREPQARHDTEVVAVPRALPETPPSTLPPDPLLPQAFSPRP